MTYPTIIGILCKFIVALHYCEVFVSINKSASAIPHYSLPITVCLLLSIYVHKTAAIPAETGLIRQGLLQEGRIRLLSSE